MINIRIVAQGGLLICISAVLQLLATAFGEIFVFASILSSIPIYILSRINPKVGIIGYMIAGLLIFLFNAHEGLFFLFTNGPVGFALGAFNYLFKSKTLISVFSGIVLTISLGTVNFIVGIPVFGINLPGNLISQICILLAFSVIYCFIYLLFASFIFNFLRKRYPFN